MVQDGPCYLSTQGGPNRGDRRVKAGQQNGAAPAKARATDQAVTGEERARVVLVDDDGMARRVVRDALQEAGYIVIAEASGGREGVELSLYYRPDVVVMDVAMPGMDGLEATRKIVAGDPSIKVVMLTSSDDDDVAFAGLRAGAVGFVSKDIDLSALPRVLDSAHRGEAVISRRMTMRLVESVRSLRPDGGGMRPVRSRLTSREWEVLDLMCENRSTEAIADELVLSPETVRSHVKSILRKFSVNSRKDAVVLARRMRVGETVDRAAGSASA
jgi:two-component system, NarL family, response regulator LiaR